MIRLSSDFEILNHDNMQHGKRHGTWVIITGILRLLIEKTSTSHEHFDKNSFDLLDIFILMRMKGGFKIAKKARSSVLFPCLFAHLTGWLAQ